MEDRQGEPFGKTLFKSILGCNTSEEGTGGEHHYETRLKGKWVQLSNPDRARPKPAEGSNAQQKTRRRDQRLVKRFKQEEKLRDSAVRRGKADGKGQKGKAADTSRIATAKTAQASNKDDGKPLSRRKRKQMSLEDGFDDNIRYVKVPISHSGCLLPKLIIRSQQLRILPAHPSIVALICASSFTSHRTRRRAQQPALLHIRRGE